MPMIREHIRSTVSGWVMLLLLLLAVAAEVLVIVGVGDGAPALLAVALVAAFVVEAVMLVGFFVVYPNEAKVLTLFGKYSGSVKKDGFHWANPLLSKKRLSLRIRNFESQKIKVNDLEGNPIEIAAIVVWRVVETA